MTMDKRFVTILAVIIILFGGFFFLTKGKNNNSGSNNGNSAQPSNHVIGKNTSGVAFVEYGDYQCPFCGQYYPLVKQVVTQYGDQISFQFRNFPLVQIHKNAMASARAAEAAGKQGKYFEMHDLLYENQSSWSVSSSPTSFFNQYATQLSLNSNQFTADMNSQAVLDTINADTNEGQKLGVDSTPSFFINGKKITSQPRSVADFVKIIDAAKTKK
jgi:protein-disulfide isomerase